MDGTVSGGDVGRFAYCPLNWKRSLEGDRGTGGAEGIRIHGEVAGRVDALEAYQRHGRHSLAAGMWLALFAASAASLGAELFTLRPTTRLWWVFIFLSVLWMAASLYLFVFHLHFEWRARTLVRSTRIEPGTVVFADSTKTAEVFASNVLPLRGRPDYVVERAGVAVPVELKTGRTPKAPYDSHVLQLAAYCYLATERYGKRPPYGILTYPERSFEVEYTPVLEDRLVRTLLRMQLAMRLGEAHRDHTSRRRCATCSRREGCPERLA